MRGVKKMKVLLAGLVSALAGILTAGTVTVRPQATDEALVNPGMGWVFYKYSNRIWAYGANTPTEDTLDWFPGCSTAYFRLTWNDLEPEEGDFRWEIFDTYAQPWIAKGKKIALRVMTCSQVEEGTPEFVRKAGAKGHWFTYPKKSSGLDFPPRWEPVYDDPVFLEKLENFMRAMAARYDGDPNVAFIDIGSLGIYGEGAPRPTYPLTAEERAQNKGVDPNRYPPPWKTRLSKLHIDLWRKHFPRSQLIALDGFDSGWNPNSDGVLMQYCRENGIGFRDDSIFCYKPPHYWKHDGWARTFAKTMPVVIETGHYTIIGADGRWQTDKLLTCIEDHQASYFSIHHFPKDHLQLFGKEIEEMNLRLGYRFVLREATFPDSVAADTPLTITSTWENAGVAPCYAGATLCWSLVDAEGNVRWSVTDDQFDFRSLAPTLKGKAHPQTVSSRVRFGRTVRNPDPDNALVWARDAKRDPGVWNVMLPSGVYTLCVSVGSRLGKPEIALPLAKGRPDRRYPLGQVTVTDAPALSQVRR